MAVWGFLRSTRKHRSGAPGAQDLDAIDRAADSEGAFEPNTAALTDGAPPAGAGGRTQPTGRSVDPRPPVGPSEGEVQNLPG